MSYAHSAMSIDLGVEFVKMALIKPGVPMEIVLNKESHRKTPFALTIKQGERFFGSEALKKGVAATRNTYTFFFDIVGKPFNDPAVQDYQRRFPHLQLKQNERGGVDFVTDAGEMPVETLLAMVLANARSEVETYANQPVIDAVLAVPDHFGPAERKAVESAAQIAGIRPLQLLSAGASAALNYGVFRYKDITEQPQVLLIYDVGATKVQATVVQYLLAKDEAAGGAAVPRLEVIGVGHDTRLGGHFLTLKLRDMLVEAFRKQHPRTEGDIEQSPQAMAKLLREADRVKQVLSANHETFAQVECLFQDLDFRTKCTRQELEEMFKEFEPRLLEPVKSALNMANLSVDKLDRILLMGAGTRVPRLQELLGQFFNGMELSRNLNTDEAIALGAVYQAARESKNFIVKRFDVVDSPLPQQKVQIKAMDEKEVARAKAILFEFENREKAKFERDQALNSLEAAVFDYSSKMEEDDFKKFGNKEELELIAKLLTDLKEWLEDVPDEADAGHLREKRRELVKPIRKMKNRKKQKEERPEFIEKLSKALEDAEKHLQSFMKTTEVFTEPELGTFSQLVAETKQWFHAAQREFDSIQDHSDAAYSTDDLSTKTKSLKRELKLLSDNLKTAAANKPKEESPEKAKQSASSAATNGEKNGSDVEMQDAGAKTSQKNQSAEQQQTANNGTMELD